MKRLFAITLLVLLIPAAAWAPTGGAGFGFPTFYLFDSGTTLAPLSSGYNLAIGGTDSNAPAYITSTGDTQFRGPLADVRTYASFASAITSISTTATTLLIPSAQTVSTDVTVPSNIELMFTQNGSLAIDTGMTVTINGPQDAGLHQIYSGSGSVSFGDGYIKEVYPQWWGAVGDGTTDDSTPAQSSITAAATGPIPIYFPSGTYIISTQLTVTSDNMYLYGDGDLSILKMKANTDANILYAYGTTTTYINNFRVSNLTFDGNRLNQTTEGTTRIGVHVRYADGVNIKDNRFINAGWDTASANAIGKAVQIENVTNTRILDNYFYDNHMAIAVAEGSNITPSIVIPTDLVADLLISGNYIDGNISAHAGTSPWAVDQISLQIKSATVVSNNIIKNVSNNFMGIFVSAASGAGAGERAVISNNSFYNIGGVAIESDSSASLPGGLYYSITSNYIDSTGQHGIANFGNAVISNNTILNTYDGVQTGGYGISGGASDLLISGNLIADYRDTTKMVSGVFILPTDDNTSTNIKVSDNIIRGSTGSSINITTTDTGTTTRITKVSVTNNMTIGAISLKAQTSTNVNGVDNAIVSGNISSAYAGPNGTDNVSVFNNNFGGVGPYSTTIPTANGAFEGQFVKNSTPANPGSSPGPGMASGWRYATADTSWMPLFAHPNNVAPANSGSDCSQGMTAEDDSYFYICISTNRWEKVPITGGGTIPVLDGGTGKSSYTQYTIPFNDTTTSFGEISNPANSTQYLQANATLTGYRWTTPSGSGDMTKAVYDTDADNDIDLAAGGTNASLSDPGANRLWGWDDVDNDIRFFTIGSGLAYDTTTDTLSSSGASAPIAGTNISVSGQTVSMVANLDGAYINESTMDASLLGGTITSAQLAADIARDSELFGGNFSDLAGSITDAQVPTNITIDARTIAQGGTSATTASGARTALGLAIGSDVQAYSANMDTDSTDDYTVGGTDVAVTDGGTGASSLTDGGVLLGSGTGAITPMAVLGDGEMIVGDGTTDPVAESGATLRTSIGVGTGDTPQFTGIEVGHATDTTLTRLSAGVLAAEGVTIALTTDLTAGADDWDTTGTLTAKGKVSNHTTNTAIILTAADCRGVMHVNNDNDAVDWTLPVAAAGLNCGFVTPFAAIMTVDPAGTESQIYLTDGTALSAGNAADSAATISSYGYFYAISGSKWMMIGAVGTWSDGGVD